MNLIIINGPCGVGKSTIAALVHAQLPFSFLLDIDAQTRFISHYQENKEVRWKLAYGVSYVIAESVLALGHDVIIDKMLPRAALIDPFLAIAEQRGATVHEYILWAPKDVVLARCDARGWREGGLLTPEKAVQHWDSIDAVRRTRPQAQVMDTTAADPETIAQSRLWRSAALRRTQRCNNHL